MSVFKTPERLLTRRTNIQLVGAGGTGSHMADQLASLEVTLRKLGHPGFRVVVFDPDHVTDSNVGRQRFTPADIGLAKAAILVHRINAFYGLDWTAVPEEHYPEYIEQNMDPLVITAVDRALVRAEIGASFSGAESDAMWLDMGNGPTSGNVIFGHLGVPTEGEIRLPNVFDLYPELADMQAADEEQPSCSTEDAINRQEWPVNRMAAMLGADLLWSLFRHGRISHHGAFFQLGATQVTPLAIDPQGWEFMGYHGQNDQVSDY